MAIRLVELQGDARERGLQHGRALGDEIAQAIAIYRQALPGSDASLVARAADVEDEIRRRAPEIADEMAGIAEGADVARWWIHVLNARSELMSSTDGCTAVFAPEAGLLAQTWDWIEPIEHLFAVLRIERPDGHRILTISEPGHSFPKVCQTRGSRPQFLQG